MTKDRPGVFHQNGVDRRMKKFITGTAAVFTAIATGLSGVLFNIGVIQHDYFEREVLEQLTLETTVSANRGSIYDCSGNILATNATVWLLFISPRDIAERMKEDEEAKAKYNAATAKERESMKKTWVYTLTDENGATRDVALDVYIATLFSGMFDISYDKIMEKCGKKTSRYAEIKKDITDEQADAIRAVIKEHGLVDQIYIRATTQRYYPYDSLASHAIGFLNSDGKGIYGLEAYYNDLLEGTSGKYVRAQDAHNKELAFEFETYIAAENGYNIVTTLDMNIQYALENQLNATRIESCANERVTGIVMDVKTGGILAMATSPGFDLNDPYTLDEDSLAELAEEYEPGTQEYNSAYYESLYYMWNNKAVTNLYEPGSTFKIITSASALEENVVKVTDHFFCAGSLRVEGYGQPISCHRRGGHGNVTFAEGLQQSCNPTLMQVAARLGTATFYKYFKSFGYTSRTGIDLPGEVYGIYHDEKDFHNVELAVYSFGQTFKTTPIQQLTAISAIANGGWLVTPHLMKEVTDSDGNVVETYVDKNKRQVISKETSKILAQILEEGVSGNGGAKNAYVKGYRVAAKTGTSQKRDKFSATGEDIYRVGSCVAFAPADDPQVAVVIIVDEPMKGSVYGSIVAAPYVSNLLSYILPYLGIEPQYTEEEQKKIEISIGNYVGATVETANADLGWRGIKYEIIGDGDTITAQVPKAGSTIEKERGKLLLYCGSATPKNSITVPDVVGKTAENANRVLVNLGLNVVFEGAQNYTTGEGATVISQSPAAGETVPEATVVKIELRHLNISDD